MIGRLAKSNTVLVSVEKDSFRETQRTTLVPARVAEDA
jgi:hypothetical protein